MSALVPPVVPPLAAEVAAPLAALLTAMADDELVLGWTDSEWTGIAPLLEEDVAMSSLAQDEIGHAQALYGLLAALPGGAGDADAIAFDRAPAEYRHARLLDHGRGDWAMAIARRFLYEAADAVRLEALATCSWKPLAELVAKLQREERYHRLHVEAWFDRLARDAGEGRARLTDALARLGPDAATVFAPLPGEAALLDAGIWSRGTRDQERTWRERVEPVLASVGLPPLPASVEVERGRLDRGPAFAALHAEMTRVRHADPGATW